MLRRHLGGHNDMLALRWLVSWVHYEYNLFNLGANQWTAVSLPRIIILNFVLYKLCLVQAYYWFTLICLG